MKFLVTFFVQPVFGNREKAFFTGFTGIANGSGHLNTGIAVFS
jgi:hypothetical protein